MRRSTERSSLIHRAASFVALVSVLLALAGCTPADKRLASMVNLEPSPPSADRVKELKVLIDKYGDTVAEAIKASLQQADSLKLLAQEYIRQEMYGPALDALDQAIRITPQNQVLHYLAGVAAGFLGKAQAQDDARLEYLLRSQKSYELAIAIEPDYIDALYGLGVLDVFELNEPDQAVPYLEHVLELNKAHIQALFVLARAYAALGNVDKAVDAYDQIVKKAPDAESRQRAERNRTLLLGGTS